MSSSLLTVHVDLGPRSYDISIGSGVLGDCIDAFVEADDDLTHVALVTDANVDTLHGDAVADRFAEAEIDVDILVVDPGETSKDPDVALELWERLFEEGSDRKTLIVAVGGGVVGDLAGFAAATFARGVRFLQIPTTLLAQVDSSVGGKVGINLPGGKNMVGAFWQPIAVFIDVDVLQTLPEREYRSGLAEVVKYGVIRDAEFFAYLEQHVAQLNARDPEVLTHVVNVCCRIKADVVAQDEREESGARAILNYGHTFCHALEAATGYGHLLHGEGVAIGMLCASRLAERLGRIGPAETARQHDLLTALKLPTEVPEAPPAELLRLMRRDKKATHGRLRFVLPSRLGEVELVENVSESQVVAALESGRGA